MNMRVTIKDETFAKDVINELTLSFPRPTVTVAEIIRERVQYEVDQYNLKAAERHFTGLIQPSESEVELNGYTLKKGRQINAEKQIETALKAFESNGFFMLIDDTQVETLDETVTLHPEISVVFLKLVPLVGG